LLLSDEGRFVATLGLRWESDNFGPLQAPSLFSSFLVRVASATVITHLPFE